MIAVPITDNWMKENDTASFLVWVAQNNIAEGDWDFKTTAGILFPTFLFRYEEDVIAFKLRFDL
jgi:hypothetical protein